MCHGYGLFLCFGKCCQHGNQKWTPVEIFRERLIRKWFKSLREVLHATSIYSIIQDNPTPLSQLRALQGMEEYQSENGHGNSGSIQCQGGNKVRPQTTLMRTKIRKALLTIKCAWEMSLLINGVRESRNFGQRTTIVFKMRYAPYATNARGISAFLACQ